MFSFPRFLGKGRFRSRDTIDPEDVFLDSSNLSSLDTDQFQGQLEKPLSPFISSFFIVGIVGVISLFSVRLYGMQIKEGDYYSEKAINNHLKSTPLFAHRGTIVDKNGVMLAWNESDDNNATSTSDIPRRTYITTPGFSHLLGYVTYPKKDISGIFWQDEYIGKDGLEKQYQEQLQGISGEKLIAVSARHEVESENITVDPIDGENIKLSVDSAVQAKFYEAMEKLAHKASFVSGAGVIMDIHTGEILSIVSYPEYNNNLMANASSSFEKAQVASDLTASSNKFINRAVSGLFTPGSTVKPFVAYAALAEGVITPEKQILSTGELVIKNKYGGPDSVFKDWKAHGYVDMRKAIAESSDEYFYQVGGGFGTQKGLGIARIDKYASMFGFSSLTGIDLPGERAGVIPTPEWKKKIFNEDWLLGDTYHTSIGQYGFQITALELARADAAIANGGILVTPHVAEVAKDTSSEDLHLDDSKLEVLREGMRKGVLEGTGKALDIPGVTVASKSGTAELGVTKQLVNSWISGYFPYENPKYAFAVIMEKGDRHNPYGAVFVMRELLEWMRDTTTYTK